MRRQTSDFDCGPAALANALEVHHRRIGLRGLRALCGTTEATGTDEDGIKRALLAYGFGIDEHTGASPREAHLWLVDSLQNGRPAILCCDRWQHWTTAIGAVAGQVIIYDPARETGGTFVLRFKDLRARWEAARPVQKAGGALGIRFYGIGVGKCA